MVMTDKEIVEKGIEFATRLYRFKHEQGEANKDKHGRAPDARTLPDFLTTDDADCKEAWQAAARYLTVLLGIDLLGAAERYRQSFVRDDTNTLVEGFSHEHLAVLEQAAQGKCSCVPIVPGIRKGHRPGCEVRLIAQIADVLHKDEFRQYPA